MTAAPAAKPYKTRAEARRLANMHKTDEIARLRAARSSRAAGDAAPRAAPRAEYVKKKTAIEWLVSKKKLTKPQAAIAERYAGWWRGAGIEGPQSIKSALDVPIGAGGAKGGRLPVDCTETAEWMADCRAKIRAAHAALHNEERMVHTLEAIAGRGVYVTEITKATRQVEEIEGTLRNALSLLLAYERQFGRF
jgi:hypothetical protein